MTNLPTLQIGCGKLLPISSFVGGKGMGVQVPCGEHGKLFPKRLWLCDLCQHNLDAVKAHAAAHYEAKLSVKDAVDFIAEQFGESKSINNTLATNVIQVAIRKYACVAVLELAGLTKEDLK